jgi:hypothetical protein
MIVGARYLLLALKGWVSGMCRLPPPATLVSASPMEKTDAQIPITRGRVVPTADPCSKKVRRQSSVVTDIRSALSLSV